MASREEELSADRLCAASAAVMRAVKEITDTRARSSKGRPVVAPYPPDLMGSSTQPSCLCDFTKHEVAEATAFLVRMGFLQYPRHAA